MYSFGILLLLCHLSRGVPAPTDAAVIQIQQWLVLGGGQVVQEVLLNGVSLNSSSREVSSVIRTMTADAPPPLPPGVNQTAIPRNQTVLRLRECKLEGSQVHWSDRVMLDGNVQLTLNQWDRWTAQTPQAIALKTLWEQDPARTRRERIHLQEGCVKLMTELRLSAKPRATEIPMAPFLVPVFALLALVGLIIIGIFISKKQGLRHSGGVLGSIIHYPPNMTEMPPDKEDGGYQALNH
ncbi:uncharacterized protein LOC115375882 [Myripristis murdjan]|uniref:uncharacterized protein LOC115375882 n=1 Tax=Myripristis murdjan TaxID=586833 RepID=UPI0011762FA2|nr:uncharacterized protein LOC115375882 [Myripristis murdjan]XP_029931327.1 uncharacterized protein LOC115375882 [Myripristis murdjan]